MSDTFGVSQNPEAADMMNIQDEEDRMLQRATFNPKHSQFFRDRILTSEDAMHLKAAAESGEAVNIAMMSPAESEAYIKSGKPIGFYTAAYKPFEQGHLPGWKVIGKSVQCSWKWCPICFLENLIYRLRYWLQDRLA